MVLEGRTGEGKLALSLVGRGQTVARPHPSPTLAATPKKKKG